MKKAVIIAALLSLVLAFGASAGKAVAPTAEDTKPLKAGDTIPDVTVKTADGKPVNLKEAVAGQPAVLIFYRGGWCPFCSKHLKGVQDVAPELTAMGYQILGISGDQPDQTKESIPKLKVDYTLLSDGDLEAAKAFGLAFQLDDSTIERYENFGIKMMTSDGESRTTLPVPAVYVVAKDGTILYEYHDPDYKVRLDPEELVAEAKKAKTS